MTMSNGLLAEQLAGAKGWDNLLRQLMLAGKALQVLDADKRIDETEVKGCQSRVWLCIEGTETNSVSMLAWSDSKIIRGVLAVIQEKVHHLAPEAIAGFDFENWFHAIQLERYLSQSRASGIAEVIKQIRLQSKPLL